MASSIISNVFDVTDHTSSLEITDSRFSANIYVKKTGRICLVTMNSTAVSEEISNWTQIGTLDEDIRPISNTSSFFADGSMLFFGTNGIIRSLGNISPASNKSFSIMYITKQ